MSIKLEFSGLNVMDPLVSAMGGATMDVFWKGLDHWDDSVYVGISDDPNHFRYEINLSSFPAGEPLVQFSKRWDDPGSSHEFNNLIITFTGYSSDEFMQLCAVLEYVKNNPIIKRTKLVIPYFPGARQDRRDGTPLTVKMYADIINSFQCDEVEIWDPHSDVTPALINNCKIVSSADILLRYLSRAGAGVYTGIIAPDAGAAKKAFKVAQNNNLKFTQASKNRDTATGKLSGFDVPVVEDGTWLVVDDICDGGGTFLGLADKFFEKNPNSKLHLYVTHGIFTAKGGVKPLLEKYEKVITTNSWNQTKNEQSDNSFQVINF